MAIGERSIADVVQDIANNVESIVRSELRLAKAELMSQLEKVKAAVPILFIGVVATTLAMFFLSWTAIYALALVLPMWGGSSGGGAAANNRRGYHPHRWYQPGEAGAAAGANDYEYERECAMDQRTSQIEHLIHAQREDLDRNLRELERKVKGATDWRLQFQNHRRLFLGAAFATGLLLAVRLKRRHGESTSDPRSHGLKSTRQVA